METGIATALLSYLQNYPTRMVTVDELEKAFTGKLDRRQIMSNMANLLKTEAGKTITRIQTGVWVYSPNGERQDQKNTRAFEVLRELPDGLILLSDDDRIYRAREVN